MFYLNDTLMLLTIASTPFIEIPQDLTIYPIEIRENFLNMLDQLSKNAYFLCPFVLSSSN